MFFFEVDGQRPFRFERSGAMLANERFRLGAGVLFGQDFRQFRQVQIFHHGDGAFAVFFERRHQGVLLLHEALHLGVDGVEHLFRKESAVAVFGRLQVLQPRGERVDDGHRRRYFRRLVVRVVHVDHDVAVVDLDLEVALADDAGLLREKDGAAPLGGGVAQELLHLAVPHVLRVVFVFHHDDRVRWPSVELEIAGARDRRGALHARRGVQGRQRLFDDGFGRRPAVLRQPTLFQQKLLQGAGEAVLRNLGDELVVFHAAQFRRKRLLVGLEHGEHGLLDRRDFGVERGSELDETFRLVAEEDVPEVALERGLHQRELRYEFAVGLFAAFRKQDGHAVGESFGMLRQRCGHAFAVVCRSAGEQVSDDFGIVPLRFVDAVFKLPQLPRRLRLALHVHTEQQIDDVTVDPVEVDRRVGFIEVENARVGYAVISVESFAVHFLFFKKGKNFCKKRSVVFFMKWSNRYRPQ